METQDGIWDFGVKKYRQCEEREGKGEACDTKYKSLEDWLDAKRLKVENEADAVSEVRCIRRANERGTNGWRRDK